MPPPASCVVQEVQAIGERKAMVQRLAAARAGGAGKGWAQELCGQALQVSSHAPPPPPTKSCLQPPQVMSNPPKSCLPLAGELPPLIGDYQVMLAIGDWVQASTGPVTSKVLGTYRGVRLVSMGEWAKFQTALLLLFVSPLAMAPTRESILPHLRHPSYWSEPCDQCGSKECKGCRIEMIPGSQQWCLRAGHHKTDTSTGRLLAPMPEGLASLVGLWAECSLKFSGRMAHVKTLFYSFSTGEPFTEDAMSGHVVATLRDIMKGANLPAVTARGLRHLFATGFSDYAAACGANQRQLRELQSRAAGLMGTSRSKFEVGQGRVGVRGVLGLGGGWGGAQPSMTQGDSGRHALSQDTYDDKWAWRDYKLVLGLIPGYLGYLRTVWQEEAGGWRVGGGVCVCVCVCGGGCPTARYSQE